MLAHARRAAANLPAGTLIPMIDKDYTKEVGLPSVAKNLPRPVSYAIMVVVAIVVVFGIVQLAKEAKGHDTTKPFAAAKQ